MIAQPAGGGKSNGGQSGPMAVFGFSPLGDRAFFNNQPSVGV